MYKNKREIFKKNRESLEIDGNWENVAEEIAKERDSYKNELEKLRELTSSSEIIDLDPGRCRNWTYSDRNSFELGDIEDLAEDIKNNGQLQPAIVRKINHIDFDYEIIAGERRWRACSLVHLPLKAIVIEKDDLDCLIIQTSENKKHGLSPYSLAKVYMKLMDELDISQNELARRLGMAKTSLSDLMSFNKVPQFIWDHVEDMTKVSPTTASFLASICSISDTHLNAVLSVSSKIREGFGTESLRKLIDKILLNSKTNRNHTFVFENDLGEPLFRLSTSGRFSLSSSLLKNIDIQHFGEYIKNYFIQPVQ